MDKEIVVKNERLKKILEWFEKKSLPVQALILTGAGFLALTLLLSLFALTYFVFGVLGLVLVIIFCVSYVGILSAML